MLSKLKGLLKYLVWLFIIPIALFSLYTWASLNWVYSSGERAGYVQKFSLKGYICKTWEGEIVLVSMPGTQAEKFTFTVKDDNVAKKVNNSMGQRIKLIYEEHKGIPSSCFGETPYFVQDVHLLEPSVTIQTK
ncbi:MAG TPA: hypothetical protein VK946_06885 [Methylotenera sp.]|nr:hypothetical protein [Methylotenera sp.]